MKRDEMDREALARAHFFEAPPPGFDPLQASDRELALYGFPRRPDPELHPRMAASWRRVMARPLRVIKPILKVNHDVVHGPRRRSVVHDDPSSWSGAVAYSATGQTFTAVSATWTVPSGFPPASAWNGCGWNDGTWVASQWVGIDGDGSTIDILQAGTDTIVTVQFGQVSVSCDAWYEWYPGASVNFANFLVSPGDTITCVVCAPSTTLGFAALANLNSSQATSIGFDAPPPFSLSGNSAEWILERPSDADGNLYHLPNYGAAMFYDVSAATNSTEMDLGSASTIDMFDGSTLVSTGVKETDRLLLTYYGTNGP